MALRTTVSARNVMLYASEVPVIAGLNTFRPLDDLFYTIWKRTAPEQVEKWKETMATGEHRLETREEKYQRLIQQKDMKQATTALLQRASQASTTSSDLKVWAAVFRRQFQEHHNFATNQHEYVIEETLNKMQQEYGKGQEPVALKVYEENWQEKVWGSNMVFYKRTVGRLHDSIIRVGGRIDGISDSDRLIEIKNRRIRFKDPLPA